MGNTDLVLREDDYRDMLRIAEKLLRQANARYVGLIDRNGQPIVAAGSLPDVDGTALASLAAGNVAATEGLANLIGETTFSALYHEGEHDHLHLSSVGGSAILLVTFDERSSLGLVRLRVRQITPEIEEALETMMNRSAVGVGASSQETVPLAEITDEDIDGLFGDAL